MFIELFLHVLQMFTSLIIAGTGIFMFLNTIVFLIDDHVNRSVARFYRRPTFSVYFVNIVALAIGLIVLSFGVSLFIHTL